MEEGKRKGKVSYIIRDFRDKVFNLGLRDG